MKRFTIREQRQEVKVEINPKLVETLDETLDNLTVVLLASDVSDPYSPMTPFNLEEQINGTWEIISPTVITCDNVEIMSSKPIKYKHTITATQKHQLTTKHLIRNNVFSEDFLGAKTSYISTASYNATMNVEYIQATYEIGVEKDITLVESYEGRYENQNYIITRNNSLIEKDKIDLSQDFKLVVNFNSFIIDSAKTDTTTYLKYHITTKSNSDTWEDVTEDLPVKVPPTITFSSEGMNDLVVQLDNDFENNLDITNFVGTDGTRQISVKNWFLETDADISVVIENKDIFGEDSYVWDNLSQQKYPINLTLSVKFESKSKKTKSVYEAIQELLLQLQQYGNGNYKDALFLMPTYSIPKKSDSARVRAKKVARNELYTLLTETPAPNFTFTQSTFFDALAEIFRLFDATFSIDEDNYLTIEYFNDQNKIDNPSIVGKNKTLNEDRYANKLLTYYQNTQIKDRYPNTDKENTFTNVSSKTIGVPSQTDFAFMLPKPIYLLEKLVVDLGGAITFSESVRVDDGTTHLFDATLYIHLSGRALDITDYVVENSLYGALNVKDNFNYLTDYKERYTNNCLTYSQGNKYIDISNNYKTDTNLTRSIFINAINSASYSQYGITTPLITDTIPEWRKIKFYAEYIALNDGRLEIESLEKKYDGSILVNQANGSIDINKLGLNMVGLSLKLGQPKLNMVQTFSNWEDRVKKGQFFIDENGDKWVANICNYTFIKEDVMQTTIEFVKNFNSLATRIQLNSEKRLSNISTSLTQKCEDNYGEYVYFSTSDFISAYGTTTFNQQNIIKSIKNAFGGTEDVRVEYSLINTKTRDNKTYSVGGQVIKDIICPMVSYASGNSICLEMSFESPISAGNQLLTSYSQFWSSGYFSKPVIYTNENGVADLFDIQFIRNVDINSYYPQLRTDSGEYQTNYTEVGKLLNYGYYKKSNEIFALNYQLHFLPKPSEINDLFIGTELVKNNGLIAFKKSKKMYFYHSLSYEYSILDTKGSGDRELITSIEGVGNYGIKISWSGTQEYSSWAICDEEGNIYLAHNLGTKESASNLTFYVSVRHNRL